MYGINDARQQLLQTVTSLSEETLQRKPDENTWSVLEILEHLYLVEKWFTNMIHQTLKQNERMKAPKEKPIHRTTDRSFKVEAPDSLKPDGMFVSLEIARTKLDESRQILKEILQSYQESDFLENSAKHPIFGTMSVAQLIEFIGLHELRHLKQIEEVISSL